MVKTLPPQKIKIE